MLTSSPGLEELQTDGALKAWVLDLSVLIAFLML